jgi:GMP synthase-like glutamine amidotransferase
MRVHCLLHAAHEDSGCIEPWLLRRGCAVTMSPVYAGAPLPAPRDFDWLIVMGGPMNVDEHAAHPWLEAEKRVIADAIDADKRVLGVCLGAQLVARALGAAVTRNPETEIGWFEVRRPAALTRHFADFPERFEAFHWHGDTFALPRGAQLLMSSEACAHQAFEYGARVAAIQFHLEVTAANARDWLAHEAPPPARYVQTGAAMLGHVERFAANNRLMHRLLDALAA